MGRTARRTHEMISWLEPRRSTIECSKRPRPIAALGPMLCSQRPRVAVGRQRSFNRYTWSGKLCTGSSRTRIVSGTSRNRTQDAALAHSAISISAMRHHHARKIARESLFGANRECQPVCTAANPAVTAMRLWPQRNPTICEPAALDYIGG